MDKLNLEVGWDIDNASLKAGLDQSKKTIEGVDQSVDKTVDSVEKKFKKIVENQALLSKSYSQLEIQAKSYASIISKSHDVNVIAKYNQKLAETKAEMARIRSLGTFEISTKSQKDWNGLQNSINQIGRELPAFTYSAQTGFIAISNNLPILADEIAKVRKENDLLSASGQKGVPVWKQLLGGLLSWQTGMVIGITLLTVYGKEIGEWVKGLFKGKDALSQLKKEQAEFNAIRLKGTQDATKELASLDSLYKATQNSTLSLSERNKAVDALQKKYPAYFNNMTNEAILAGNAKGAYDKLTQSIIAAAQARAYENKIAEISSKIIENNDKVTEKANSITKAQRLAMQLDRDIVSSGGMMMFNTGGSDAYKAIEDINTLNKDTAELTKTMNKYKTAISNLVAINGVGVVTGDVGGVGGTEKAKETLEAYNNLIADIRSLDNEYKREKIDNDQAELLALQDKFDKIRQKITEFNKDPKNKFKISLSDLDVIQTQAESNLSYTQNTARLQKQYDEEYKVYVDYQKLKEETNAEYADKRFADDLDKIKSFESRLQSEINSIDPSTTNELEKKRLEELLKLQSDNTKRIQEAENKKYSDLLARMITYDQERKKLVEKQAQEMARAVATGADTSGLEARQREELNKLDDANIEKLASVQKLFAGIDKLTDAGARSLIDKIKALLSSDANMSAELRKEIEDALKDTTEALDDRLPERTLQIADGFAQMAQSLGSVNEGLASMLGGLSNVLRATVQVNDGIKGLTKGIANYKDNKAAGGGGLLGSLGAIAGVAGPVGQIVGAVANVVGGVVNFFKASKESARKAAEEIKSYQDSVLIGEYEYNRLLRERAREQENINDLTNEQLKLQEKLLNTQTSEAKSDYEALLRRVQQEGQQITGQKTEKYGGFLGIGKKTRVVDITAGLSGYTYNQLEELYTSNKLNEATRKLFEELKKAKEEVDGIADAWDEMQNELLDRMSGNATANAIGNSIINGFKQGRRAVSDFADDAEEIIQNALLSAMNYTVLDAPLQELIKKFRDDAKDGLNQNEIDAFQQGYNAVVQQGLDAIKEIEKVTGKTIGGNASGSLKAEAGIERISEQTATELMGVTRAQYDVSKQHLVVSQQSLEFDSRANDMLIQSLKHQAAIEQNTANTVDQLKLVVGELKVIKGNTSPQSTRAYGG